ncbi:MAG: FAD-binding oxidoreductase [Nitrospirota bacterium]|nr:FAD-binding oxidoreductase [Nitrospirota bacterium]
MLVGEPAAIQYGACTTPVQRSIPAALLPTSQEQVVALVKIAATYKVPLYPISTGRNWGYGTANPVVDGCVVVDLSRMNRIMDMDENLGLVTLEPGVTQRILNDYLEERGLDFLVPVTGAGPNCSLVGNALERGYGITPYTDHFTAVTSLEAVLADGSIYRPALTGLGGEAVDQAYKWGLGPYLDGLFSQGSFGIVTKMTIALARRPETIQTFFFSVVADNGLESAVGAVREALRATTGISGSINLMNPQRVLSMLVPHPSRETGLTGAIPTETVTRLAREYQVTAWTGVGALYGEKKIVSAARSVIKGKLRPYVQRLVFLDSASLRRGKGLLGIIPRQLPLSGKLSMMAERLDATLNIMEGHPSEIALPLAYWKSGSLPRQGMDHDPARDGCGLIWYAPLVPMVPERVRCYVEMVKNICPSYGLDPLITLTSVSDRCFDSTVPLLFSKNNLDEAVKAQECFKNLFEAGQREGFLPYRLGVHSMELATEQEGSYWDTVRRIKKALDPGCIIAPGRYEPGCHLGKEETD